MPNYIYFVQEAHNAAASASSVTATFRNNTTLGNTVVALINLNSGINAQFIPGSGLVGGGVTWQAQVASEATSTTVPGWSIFIGIVGQPGTSVTVTPSSAATCGIQIIEFAGLTVTQDSGQAPQIQQASGASITVTGLSTANANDLWISGASSQGPTANTAPSAPWIALPNFASGTGASDIQCSGAYQIVTATTAGTNITYTSGNSANSSDAFLVPFQSSLTAPTPFSNLFVINNIVDDGY